MSNTGMENLLKNMQSKSVKQLRKEAEDAVDNAVENHGGKWILLWFMKSGSTKKGNTVFETKKQASGVVKSIFDGKTTNVQFDDGDIIAMSNISCAIPMPVKKGTA